MADTPGRGGGFLSKVARFVRHPTLDWSELDAQTAGVDQEREALKAALQRKRRNDRVRHRELNDLRELMLRQQQSAQAASEVAPDAGPAFSPSRGGGTGSEKGRTIEQIARIEEQMSSQWLPRPIGVAGAAAQALPVSAQNIPARLSGASVAPAHLRVAGAVARASAFPMTIDVVTEDPHAQGAEAAALLSHPGLAEAAVRFANGQTAQAQEVLLGLMAQDGASATARTAALARLDLLRASADVSAYEEWAAEYAERFGVAVPVWPARVPAGGGWVTDQPGGVPGGSTPNSLASTWVCPLLLDVAAVAALARLTQSGSTPLWLDWTALVSADGEAAQALYELVEAWLIRPLDVRMRGSAVLRRRLKASTPSGRDENDRLWWQLRLGLLRLMRRREEFDLVALDYCVTYGVLPPTWVEPVCGFLVADTLPGSGMLEAADWGRGEEPLQPLNTELAGLDVHEWPAMPTLLFEGAAPSDWPTTQGEAPLGVLEGHLSGDIAAVLARLDQSLQAHPVGQPLRIDCLHLLRVDFAAAGSLLQWFMTASGQGVRVELSQVSYLIAAFFHVVGIDEAVSMRLRQY